MFATNSTGLKPSVPYATQEIPRCFHCGADCSPVHVEKEEKDFCCQGCASVWSLLKDHQMNGYYELNPHPGTPKNSRKTPRFDFLENAEVVQKLLDFAEGDTCKVSFRAPAIHCSSCIWLLERLPSLKKGISESRVNFPRKEISVTFDRSEISLKEVVELVTALGYEPDFQAAKDKEPKSVQRRLWLQLGIAGFCFGNIMLFSFPEYLGLNDPKFVALFSYLNIAFSIPVLAYSAADYLRSAWKSLLHRGISMDVPISLGILVLFLRSVGDILTESGPGFLDSMAGLVFFLLLGKVFQSKTYHLLSFERDYKSYFPLTVTRLAEQTRESQVPLAELKAGDRLLIRNGELIPADAVLIAGEGTIDYSFVTGESDLVAKEKGAVLYAGGRQFGSSIEVLLQKSVDQSYLTRLWDNEVFKKKEKSRLGQIADRVSHSFTWVILGIALVAGVFWWIWDASQAVQVVTSILIVACPCALALSTPFALGNALRVLGRQGFFVKNTAVIETLAGADALVFDKTGTLTHAVKGSVTWVGKPLTEVDKTTFRTLFRQSAHPLSRRIHQWLGAGTIGELTDFAELKGKGLQGRIDGTFWRAGSQKWLYGGIAEGQVGSRVYVGTEKKEWGYFDLSNHLRPGVAEVIGTFRQGYEVCMISGDAESSRSQVQAIFPEQGTLIFNQSPQDKLDFIQQLQQKGRRVIMVGDGLNDAGALQQSDTGIAVADDAAAFTPASDAILFAGAFAGLPRFLAFARSAVNVIKVSFGLSLLYNLIGLSFAVSGLLSPLVAAILMPLSSVSVIAFTTIGTSLMARKHKFRIHPEKNLNT